MQLPPSSLRAVRSSRTGRRPIRGLQGSRRLGTTALLALLSTTLIAQQTGAVFEVVSIKATAPGTQGGGFQLAPGGRLTWGNTTLKGWSRPLTSGSRDVDMMYVPEHPVGGVTPDRLALDPRFQGRPALTTALREQLGLKLEASRGPVELLVIDSVERPMPDSRALTPVWGA